jgi:peptidyl-prolyl cis-trans isomerase C
MKFFLSSVFLFTGLVWAQSTVTPATPAPGPAAGQASLPPDLPADTVVATFGHGEKLTAGELKSFLSAMPAQMQQNALRDRKAFVQQFALMHRLAALAEQAKLDQRSPTKESIAFNRMYLLMNAQLHEVLNGIEVPPAEAQAYYDKNKDSFAQVNVKAIYISFAANSPATAATGDKKKLTEAEAKAKIEQLRADIVKGADFVKLVKENSDDQTSAVKDGDFGTIRHTDNLPEAIRSAIFGLKQGDVSQPIKQPNGFYLFRAEQVTPQPFSEIQQQITDQIRQNRFNEWMEQTTHDLNLKYENDAYFSGSGGAAASK